LVPLAFHHHSRITGRRIAIARIQSVSSYTVNVSQVENIAKIAIVMDAAIISKMSPFAKKPLQLY
jgi:hypothetical protein